MNSSLKVPRGFLIFYENGLSCPSIRCDKCGHRITDMWMAGVVWRSLERRDGDSHSVRVLCKTNGCLLAPEYENTDWSWEELSIYLLRLLFNVGVKTRRQLLEEWALSEKFSCV